MSASDDVVIPHELGRDEAKARIQKGVAALHEKFGNQITSVEETWPEPYRLDVAVGFMGSRGAGKVQIEDETVRVALEFPFLLALFKSPVKAYLEQQGRLILAGRASG